MRFVGLINQQPAYLTQSSEKRHRAREKHTKQSRIANETTSSTVVKLMRSSVARANECGTVLLTTSVEFGKHWVGKGFRVNDGIRRENNAVSPGTDWGSGSGIDVGRELHSNDRRMAILKEPTKRVGGGARSVALRRRKRKIGKGSILTAYTVGGWAERRDVGDAKGECFYRHNKYGKKRSSATSR
jgi:hypothetical protein